MFDPRPYLKELARGKNGARDLTRWARFSSPCA